MTGRLALGVLLAVVAGACGSSPPSPTAVPPAPASTWDPRRDEIDQAEGVWTAEQPGTYAYTSTLIVDGMGASASRVTAIDGRVEVQQRSVSSFVNPAGTIESLFDMARASLDGNGTLKVAVDQQYGYLSSVDHATDVSDGDYTATVAEFTTPGDRTANARAKEALNQLLDRWRTLSTPAWEYGWTRVDAASAGAPTGWIVRGTDGETTAVAAGSSNEVRPPDAITIDGIVEEAVGVMASGGWVDVSADDLTGLDVLIAVDPSPATKGDGYWVRIDFTDRAAARQKELLDAARERWTAAKLKKHTYTWTYDGDRGAWSMSIAATGDVLKFLKRSAGAPSGDGFEIRPAITDAFTAIDQILGAGGTVSVTYDKALGYPKTIKISNGATVASKGTITITKFKAP